MSNFGGRELLGKEICGHCNFEIPNEELNCPHCCAGMRCPNVREASQSSAMLQARYEVAISTANACGKLKTVGEFESQVNTEAKVTMGAPIEKLLPMANGTRDIFATFYELLALKFSRNQVGPIIWEKVRPHAEIELLGGFRHVFKLHYASLSLDGESLPHYGNCTIEFNLRTIEHRISLFIENSAVAWHRDKQLSPAGKATWAGRAKLCVTKVIPILISGADSFERLIMKAGDNSIDDRFVEIQIFGSVTIKSFSRVRVLTAPDIKLSGVKRPRRKRTQKRDEMILRDYCVSNDVRFEN